MLNEFEVAEAALAENFAAEDRAKIKARLERLEKHADELVDVSSDQVRTIVDSWNSEFPFRKQFFRTLDDALGDLASRLGVKKSTRNAFRDAAAFFFNHYTPIISTLAVLATAFYGHAYAIFYDAVDATPEQVGITTTEILLRSAAGGVTFVLLVAAIIFLPAAPYLPVALGADAPEAGRGSRSQFFKLLFLVGGIWAGVMALLSAADTLDLFSGIFFTIFLVVIPVLASLRLDLSTSPHVYFAPLAFKAREFATIFLGCSVVGLISLAVFTFTVVHDESRRASDGRVVDPPTVFGVPMLGLSAEPAFLTWRGLKPAGFELPRCVLYLGQADGTTTVYDSKQHRTFQLPESEVIVTVRHDRTSCTAPINELNPRIVNKEPGVLECRHGDWTAYPDPGYSYLWTRNGVELGPRRDGILHLRPNDRNIAFRCGVEGFNGFGSDVAYSGFVVVDVPRERRAQEIAARHSSVTGS